MKTKKISTSENIDPTSEEFLARKKHFEDQLAPHALKLKEWQEYNQLHGLQRPPPIHVDDEGRVHWVNRKLRRKHASKK